MTGWPGRAGQIQPVGRGLGGGALVRQHPAGALVHHLQPAQHAGDLPRRAGGVGEAQPVDGEATAGRRRPARPRRATTVERRRRGR